MKFSVLAIVVSVVYLFVFGVLFGSHNGVMGDIVHWDIHSKTKILNSLAIFGYLSIAAGVVLVVRKSNESSSVPALLALMMLVAISYGFSFVDCAVFNFCRTGE